jgi:hypothetical protein
VASARTSRAAAAAAGVRFCAAIQRALPVACERIWHRLELERPYIMLPSPHVPYRTVVVPSHPLLHCADDVQAEGAYAGNVWVFFSEGRTCILRQSPCGMHGCPDEVSRA